MNKQACLERFQQLKKDSDDFIVVKDEEKRIIHKCTADSPNEYEFSYLEKETACFLELEPSLDGNVLTQLSYDDKPEGKMNYIILSLDTEEYIIELVANAYEIPKEGICFAVLVHSKGDQEIITLTTEDIPSALKQTLRRIYAHFKETVITSPKFRLYLATGEIKLMEEDVVKKIGENA